MNKNKVINILQLKELEGLPGEDGEDFMISILSKFLKLLPKRLDELKSAILNQNFNLICRQIHRFKTSCEIVGAETLYNHVTQIETSATNQDVSTMTNDMARLDRAAEDVKVELQHIIQKRQITIGAAS